MTVPAFTSPNEWPELGEVAVSLPTPRAPREHAPPPRESTSVPTSPDKQRKATPTNDPDDDAPRDWKSPADPPGAGFVLPASAMSYIWHARHLRASSGSTSDWGHDAARLKQRYTTSA